MEKIRYLKHRILDHIETSAPDLERVNVNELGEFVNMVGVLADAEHHCREAEYYHAVTQAMGHEEMDEHIATKSTSDNSVLDMLGDEYHNLSPDERKAMKNKVLTILGIK